MTLSAYDRATTTAVHAVRVATYRTSICFNGAECAAETEDGSWWIDWPAVEAMGAVLSSPSETSTIVRLLLATRGALREVSRQKIDEIAHQSVPTL